MTARVVADLASARSLGRRRTVAHLARPFIARRLPGLAAVALAWIAFAGGAVAQSPECARWRAVFAGMPVTQISIESGGRALTFAVKSADTGERQAGGFQCATPDEIQRHMILFDFGREITTQFHMNNVPAPLDIAFVKADGRIFSILRMASSPSKLYGPMGAFRYAIEARAGFFESQGIRQGEAKLAVPQAVR